MYHTMHPLHPKPRRLHSLISGVIGVLLGAALSFVVIWNMQSILDWWRLRNYTPPQAITSIADRTTMTTTGRKLLYVNHPQLLTGSSFTTHCQSGAEKTIVLGCYESGDRGIYLYKVTDSRLDGVTETTAAHEMLHAAYARLSGSEKTKINGELKQFYENGLTDERIKQTVEAYRTSEPGELLNEMHSIFGTEVANLPTDLETYYKRYFTNREDIVALATKYQSEFTSRRDQTVAYDAQLATLKKQIDANQTSITTKKQALDSEYAKMQRLRQAGNIAQYNLLVDSYNSGASAYNQLLASTRLLITQYNDVVEKRNAIAFEERALAQALTSEPISD